MRGGVNKLSLAALLALVLMVAVLWLAPANMNARADDDSAYRRMRVLTEVLAEIENKYVEKVPREKLINKAIKGMVERLDPHSAYLTPAEYKDLQIETKGSFFGVGIEITMRDGVLTVVSPIEDTPAFRAGVKAGDRIIKIDGKLTKGMSLMDAVKHIRGAKDTTVALTVLREGAGKLLDFPIKRGLIPLKSVRYFILDDGYGYIRLSNFQSTTTRDLVAALKVLQTQKTPLKGLVLDLRNDPGGLLNQAVSVADQFLEKGIIVSTRGRQKHQKMAWRASQTTTAGNYPIVCLINNGTASASEIVAGALQDHKRAVIMGVTSFGKGSVQTIIPLDDEGALRLTTARYYTPSGRAIQAKGIKPDVEVAFVAPPEKKDQKAAKSAAVREKDLSGAMAAEQTEAEKKKSPKNGKLYMPKDRLERDNQLVRALDLLKVWGVFKRVAAEDARTAGKPAAK